MKQVLLITAFALCIHSGLFSQASGSFFSLKLGDKTSLFKYEGYLDTLKVRVAKTNSFKDTAVYQRILTIVDDGRHTYKLTPPYLLDTVTAIDPVTLHEQIKIVQQTSVEYNVETEMSYFDFLLMLKSKFELRNPQKGLRVSSYGIRYESPTDKGMIWIKYPETSQGVITKLNCLDKGGTILLYLENADHDSVRIDTHGMYLALIHIRK